MAANTRDERVTEGDLPADVVADILSSERRRALLSCLADSDGPVLLDDLVTALREERANAPGGGRSRREIREEVYERHLPKLMATGVVEYDSMREAVRLVDRSVVADL